VKLIKPGKPKNKISGAMPVVQTIPEVKTSDILYFKPLFEKLMNTLQYTFMKFGYA
jgi:hypothetical protein